MPVFFITSDCVCDNRLIVTGPLVRHLRGGLRAKVGEVWWFSDENRRRYQVRLDDVTSERIAGEVVDVHAAPEGMAVQVTLAHAVIRAHRMSWVLQKMTELGTAHFVPLVTDRTVVRAKGTSRHPWPVERWSRIAREAAQQAGRWDVPTIHHPMDLRAFLDASVQDDVKLVLWEQETQQRLAGVLRNGPRPTRINVLVGPEGGFTDAEASAAERCGYQAVTLGPRILRSETAALAALSVIQSEFE